MKIFELINELELPTVKQAVDNFKFFSNPQIGQSGTPEVPPKKLSAPIQQKPATPQLVAPVAKAVAKPETPPFNPAAHKPTLIALAKQRGIKTAHDLANLLSQAQEETAGWTSPVEKIKYSDPVWVRKVFTTNFPTAELAAQYINRDDWVAFANRAYAGVNGNGNEASGDGWRYRGRGFLHITGKYNYAAAGAAVHPENPNIYVDHPELLSSNPKEAALAAIWYFKKKVGLGKTSKQATKAVNGTAMLKQKERQQAHANIKKSLVGQAAQPTNKR